MNTLFDWLQTYWSDVLIPLAVFVFSLIALFWLRKLASEAWQRWLKKVQWATDVILIRTLRVPSLLWCIIISAYLSLAVSKLEVEWKSITGNILWTLLLVSFTWPILNILSNLITFYGQKSQIPKPALVVTRNITRVAILIVAILILLDIWGAPTTPILLLLVAAIVAAALAFRDAVPNLFAGFQLGATQHIKIGDYIKLETGEEGYVTEIGPTNTSIRSLDENTVIIPNSRLLQRTVINYGHPLKKAKEPFRFISRSHLTELTGLKAKNLRELVNILKKSPDSIIYYHTHHFLEEHHYLTPEPSNDFAVWVTGTLGDEVLGERLASVDTVSFSDLDALRDRLIAIMEEHLVDESNFREATPGREFQFLKSVSVILPTSFVAHDLREFIQALGQVSLGSLYFHIFESKLRLGRKSNDFSFWLESSLGETELGEEVARIDPYTYTLEGLRSLLIQIIEKRIT